MDIEVVLTQDDAKLGRRGQVVKVSRGFATNFLFPHQKAKLATSSNLKSFQAENDRHLKQASERRAEAEALAKKIEAASVTVEVLVGEGEKLYGAVTSQELQQSLLNQGIAIDKKDIHLESPIKQLGAYQVTVKLHPEVTARLKLLIVKKKNA